jgi:hypothetical protein
MQIKITYKGYINGIYGIYCGFKPDGLDVKEEIPVYYPDKGKIFIKNGEEFGAVILQEDENIEDYEEINISEE